MFKNSKVLTRDEEIISLKKQIKEIVGKPAPGFHYECFQSLDDYKSELRNLLKAAKNINEPISIEIVKKYFPNWEKN